MAPVAIALAVVLALTLVGRELAHRRRQAALRGRIDELRAEARETEQFKNVGHLVSGLAQELKGPLQGVIGNIELMLARHAANGDPGELRVIRDNATRAAGIVRNLLAFTESATPTPRWQDINEIVARAIASSRAEIGASTRVTVTRRDRVPLVYVDGRQFEKVVSTLLSRPESGGGGRNAAAVTLATSHRDGREDRLVIEVERAGAADPGDPPSWPADLAACRQIMESHGGSLEVLRPSTGGCRFHLELPLTASVLTGSESSWTRSSTSST